MDGELEAPRGLNQLPNVVELVSVGTGLSAPVPQHSALPHP